jgi:imidazolonepropionase-like amidohydrolase
VILFIVCCSSSSDHPIINGKNLIYDAAKATFYGLSPEETMKAITTTPASILGIADRVGAIKEGYDGDIVLWDRHPLMIGARPDTIVVDGNVVVNRKMEIFSTYPQPNIMTEEESDKITKNGKPLRTEVLHSKCYLIRGATIHTMDEKNTLLERANILVEDGQIKCVGKNCQEDSKTCQVFEGTEMHVIPGLVESSSSLGLIEIVGESQAHEGNSESRNRGLNAEVRALDGIRLYNSRTIPAARKNGVTVTISHPISNALVMGTSTSFFLLDNERVDDMLIKDVVGLHVTLGYDTVHDLNNAISAQFLDLRNMFVKTQKLVLSRKLKRKSDLAELKDKLLNEDAVVKVLRGQIPLIAHVNQVDAITHLLRLQRQFHFKLVIVGGAEAHLVAKTLVKQDVGVVITPSRKGHAAQQRWDTMLTDPVDFGASILHAAGVKLGVSVGYAHYARDLRWIAGKIQATSHSQGRKLITPRDALAMITKNVAQMFGIYDRGVGQIRVQDTANFIVLIGPNLLSFESRVKIVAFGTRLECKPIQR